MMPGLPQRRPARRAAAPVVDILAAVRDPNLFGPWFEPRDSWRSWEAFLAALFALPMTPDMVEAYRRHTGRTTPPTTPFAEAHMVCGRRAGKTLMMATTGTFLATFRDYRPHLQPGERATVAMIAADRKQARGLQRYVSGMLQNIPMLNALVERETGDGFDLKGSVSIEIRTADFRSARGYTYAAVLCDELAFWNDGGTSPDEEILAAVRPGMASIPGAMLLCASSPHARRGALWNAYKRHYGKDRAPALVWQAASREMNPSLPARVVEDALRDDAARASAEYLAQFRSDVEQFLTVELVEAAQRAKPMELPRQPGVQYVGFVDPGGGGADEFTLSIGHRDGERLVVDIVTGRKGNPAAITADFCGVLRSYGVTRVSGDRYAGAWVPTEFARHGIEYQSAPGTRSELYASLAPALIAAWSNCHLARHWHVNWWRWSAGRHAADVTSSTIPPEDTTTGRMLALAWSHCLPSARQPPRGSTPDAPPKP